MKLKRANGVGWTYTRQAAGGGVGAEDTTERETDGVGYHVRPTAVRVLHGNSIKRDLNFHADGSGPPTPAV